MGRKITFTEGEFYHLYNRGTEKRDIFLNPSDYDRFLALLYLCNSKEIVDLKFHGNTLARASEIERKETLVHIGAYCLMPNHFHLLVQAKNEDGVSKFMQKISTAYTMYFNALTERTGSLFQGTFKAIHVDTDLYLHHLVSYIHLNPVKLIDPKWKESKIEDKSKARQFLDSYHYSSYLDYANKRFGNPILAKSEFVNYFPETFDFEQNVQNWLTPLGLQG